LNSNAVVVYEQSEVQNLKHSLDELIFQLLWFVNEAGVLHKVNEISKQVGPRQQTGILQTESNVDMF